MNEYSKKMKNEYVEILKALKEEGLTSHEAIAFILMRELRYLETNIENMCRTLENRL